MYTESTPKHMHLILLHDLLYQLTLSMLFVVTNENFNLVALYS